MIPLRDILFNLDAGEKSHFPFNVPTIHSLEKMHFGSPVTFFVGENGSGKSTCLELIAMKIGSVTIGRASAADDPSLSSLRPYLPHFKLIWNKKTHRGFFLRAEDFFGFVLKLKTMRRSFLADLDRIDGEYKNRSDYAKKLAKMPAQSSLKAMENRYGIDLDAQSHGEAFLTLFQSRFVPGGLYLLDEPEAALSPIRQLGLIAMLKDMVAQDAQFLIATHSPILLAFPDAAIFDFDQHPPEMTAYDDLPHIQFYRSFMESPESFFRRLSG